jgi:hypothetical protein
MLKFDNYPIYVNHPGRWEIVRQQQRDYFVARGDYKMMTWLDYTGKRLYEITADKAPGPESVQFERAVVQLLRIIGSTKIGKLLFESLDPQQKYWILPLDYLDKNSCACSAYTFPGQPKERGGIRVYFNPTDFNGSDKKWFSGDDILFHELVHAYRMGRVGYDVVNAAKPMNADGDAEEFFALHMQNVYLANRGGGRFYRNYNSLQSVSKGSAYQAFAGDAEALMAFRHFVEKEPLATKVSRWMQPADSFNPWRDHAVLERMLISANGLRMPRLPAF